MGNDGVARRASYGPRSPVVGERGARTRAHILDVALGLFAERGYHATSVDDVAVAAGVSRATLYQYFEGKDQVFAELLDECGGALLRLIRRLGRLGPTAAGFDNLHWWLGEWAWVYDRYAPMFVQWDVIDHSGRPFRPMVATFVDAYAAGIAARLGESGFADPERLELGAALLLVVHRVNLYRHTEFVRVGERELLDGLAVVVQLVLFPETPPDVVAGLVTCAPDEAARPPVPRPFAAPPTSRPDLGTRAQGTVRQLLDAGLAAFSAHGFRHANLDAVAADAGVARATLYKYFRDKASLLVALSEEAARAVIAEVERLPELYPPCGLPPAPADVRAWLDSYVAVNARYRGVLAVWFDEPEMPRSVRVAAAAASAHLYWGVAAFLGALDRPYPFHPQAAALVMLALLQRVPAGLAELFPDRPPADVARTMAVFVQRGLLNRAAAPADGRPLRPPHTRRERPRPDRTESTVHGGPRITHLDDLPWMVVSKLEFADGRTAAISEKWIEQTPRYVTYYNKWEPGAMVPNHGHHGDHIVFVLEGEMTCGDVVCGPGTHVTLDYGDTFGPWIAGPEGLVVFGAMFNFGAGGFGSPFAGDPEGWKALLAEKGATEVPVPPTPRTPWGTQASVLLNPETPQG